MLELPPDQENDIENTEATQTQANAESPAVHLGMTQKLPNVSQGDSLAYRIETLRMYLEDQMGFEEFLKAYQLLKHTAEEEDQPGQQASENSMVDPQLLPYFAIVNQLIVCEENLFERQNSQTVSSTDCS